MTRSRLLCRFYEVDSFGSARVDFPARSPGLFTVCGDTRGLYGGLSKLWSLLKGTIILTIPHIGLYNGLQGQLAL